MKRTISAILAVFLIAGAGSALAAELEEGRARVVVGADITDEQKNIVYNTFGVERGNVIELTLTNSEERAYLEGLVPDSVIGSRAISCVYVEIGAPGSGVKVSVSNITWCSSDMYRNALVTAGIDDASIIVTAPFAVSGTAALGGIFKAYEDLTGRRISEDAKNAGTEELVITAELADEIGDYDAVLIVNELKIILAQTKDMTDDEVRAEIRKIAAENGISVTDGQVEQLLKLCRSLEGMDSAELQKRVESIQKTLKGLAKAQETAGGIAAGVSNFFKAVGNFFSNLFRRN